MDFNINSGAWGTMFGVPYIVADNFLKLASEAQIKSLLYILRNGGRICTSEEIGKAVGISATQAEECILFWQQVNVLEDSSDSNLKIQKSSIVVSPSSNKSETAAVKSEIDKPIAETSSNSLKLNPSEIAEILNESDDIKALFQMAEIQLGSLNHTMQRSLIWLYQYLGLRADVIIMLIAYCASIGKINIGYIEKIAYSWNEIGINSLELAQNEVNRMTSSRNYIMKIISIFEMKRNPTNKQSTFINSWQDSGYSIELIKYAYEKTIEQIEKLSFEYINKILENWNNSGFKSPEQVKHAEEEFKKSNKNTEEDTSNSSNVDKYKALINNF